VGTAEDKRTRLIRSAVRLVYERGFNQTSLADIARAADVPLGNVYYYFKTKDAIGQALIEQRAAGFRALQREWDRHAAPKTRLVAFVQMTVDNRRHLARHGCPIGTLCAELQKEGGPLAKQASGLFADTLAWLAAQFRAMGKEDESRELAVHLLSALEGATLLTHSFRTPSYIEREARRLKDWIQTL